MGAISLTLEELGFMSPWKCELASGKVSYPRPEETLLDEIVFRNVPEKTFSLDVSAFYCNKLLLKNSRPSLLAGIQIYILNSEITH